MRLKIVLFILLVSIVSLNANPTYSQLAKVTLDFQNKPLEQVMNKIESQSEFYFIFNQKQVDVDRLVSVHAENKYIADILPELFAGTNVNYAVLDRKILLTTDPIGENLKAENAGNAQQKRISGIIRDKNGNVLPGATILIKGTTTGVPSDLEGRFSMQIPAGNQVLVVSFIGMKTIEVAVDNRDTYEIVMEESVEFLDDIFITGYQTINMDKVTGSIAKVSEGTIEKRPSSDLSRALVGQVAGMVADPVSGFTIRGRSTLSGSGADRAPLLVVDGFPIEGGFSSINPNDVQSVDVLKDAASTSIYGARASNGVIVVTTKGFGKKGRLNVNFNSFVSIGERFDLDYYMNMASAEQQIAYEDQLWNTFKGTTFISDPYNTTTGTFRGTRSDYSTLLIELDKGYITKEYFDAQRAKMLGTDYRKDVNDYLLRNPVSQQYNLVLSGSSEKDSYKFYINYDNDLTGYQNNSNNKTILSFTNIYNIAKNIKYTFNSNATFYDYKNNGVSMGQVKSVFSPWTRIYDDEGNYTRMNYQNYEPLVKIYEPKLPYTERYNILEESTLKDNSDNGMDLRIQNEFEFRFANDFRFRPMFQYEKYNFESLSIYDEKMYASRNYSNLVSTLDATTGKYISQIPKGGIYRENSSTDRQSLKFRAQLDYIKTFKDKHDVSVLGGVETISTTTNAGFPDLKFGYNSQGLNYALFDYNVDRNDMFTNAVLENSYSYEGNGIYNYKASGFRQSYRYNERFFSLYANGSYTFDGKYTATASARTDASNYVTKTVRDKFSPFYSVGLRWNAKKEDFLANVNFLDRLSLRGAYGVTGNAAGKYNVMAVTVFSSQSATAETGNLPNGYLSGRDNDYLTWEKTYSTDLGVDFSMFKEKLYGAVDVYRRFSKDLMSSVQTSMVIQSQSSLSLNMGEVLNKGIEVTLGTNLNITKDLVWNGSLNFAYNYNEVVSYKYTMSSLFYYIGSNTAMIEGMPTDRLFMVKIVGTTKDGYYIQESKDGSLTIANSSGNDFSSVNRSTIPGLNPSQDDRIYYMGRTSAPYNAGFTNTFTFKGFTLMAVMTGKFGYKYTQGDESLTYSVGGINYSATGLASLQSPSTVATTSTGNVYPNKINQTMLGSSNSLRNFYSTVAVDDASHIRFNELYLGYDLPVNRASGKFLKSLTVYSQARNLGLLWKATDSEADPEYRIGTIKPVKTYTFGLRIGF